MGVNFTTKGHLKVVFRVVTAAVLLASLSINSTGQLRIQPYSPVQIDQRVLEQQRIQQIEQQKMEQQLEQQRIQHIEQQRMQRQLEQQRLQQIELQRMQQQSEQQRIRQIEQQQMPSAPTQVNPEALEQLRRRAPAFSAPVPDNRGLIDSMPEYPPVPEPSENLGQQPRPSRPHSGCTRQ